MADSQHQSKASAWYQALRPRVFTATYVPMGLAGIVALDDGVFEASVFLLALIGDPAAAKRRQPDQRIR